MQADEVQQRAVTQLQHVAVRVGLATGRPRWQCQVRVHFLGGPPGATAVGRFGDEGVLVSALMHDQPLITGADHHTDTTVERWPVGQQTLSRPGATVVL